VKNKRPNGNPTQIIPLKPGLENFEPAPTGFDVETANVSRVNRSGERLKP
jgi:hypothetical protein